MEEQKNTYENVTLEPDVGFDIRFVTMDHNSPFHWHREMEILYILNGHATVHMEGEEYELNPLDAVVMDYARIHLCAAADNGNLYPRVKAASAALSAGGGTFCDPLRGTASPSRAAGILQ